MARARSQSASAPVANRRFSGALFLYIVLVSDSARIAFYRIVAWVMRDGVALKRFGKRQGETSCAKFHFPRWGNVKDCISRARAQPSRAMIRAESLNDWKRHGEN